MLTTPVNAIILPLFCATLPFAVTVFLPRHGQRQTRSRGAAARQDAAGVLLTLFILSPTLGTMVAIWRGLKRIHRHWADEMTLKDRMFDLRRGPAPHILPLCRACGFGRLLILGDRVPRENARLARHPWRSDDGVLIQELGPRDRRCDRPGCHAIAPAGRGMPDYGGGQGQAGLRGSPRPSGA